MSDMILPLTLVGLIANVGSFIDTFDVFYLPPIGIALYILDDLSTSYQTRRKLMSK